MKILFKHFIYRFLNTFRKIKAKILVSKKNRFIASVFTVLAIVCYISYFKYLQNSNQNAGIIDNSDENGASPPMPVVSEVVHKGEFDVIFSGLGIVTPFATSIVKSQISGQLIEVDFVEGQSVKAGDTLAKVDPRPYEIALRQSEGQLRRDLATLHNAEKDLERYKTLRSKIQGSISSQQLDTQEALIAQTTGLVEIDQAQVEAARLNLSYCNIKSLIDGRTGLRQVDQGNYVTPNDQNGIVTITKSKPITVIFTIPENRLQPVLQQYRTGRPIKVGAYENNTSTRLASGILRSVDNQVDTSTGTVKLRAEFLNDDEKLYPSQFVNIELYVETYPDVITISTSALQHGPIGDFVYVINKGSVRIQAVKVGPAAHDRVVILSGLNDKEKIVIEGADRLREGANIIENK
jgi:membrane fusion protein, multidrug efflux system